MAHRDENGQGTSGLNEETEQPNREHRGEGMLDPSMIGLGPFAMEEYNLMISQRAAAGLLGTWSVDYEPVCWMIFRDIVRQRNDLGRYEAYVGVGNQGRDEFLLKQKKEVRDYWLRNGHTEPLSALLVSFLAIKTFWVRALEPKGLIRFSSLFKMTSRTPLNDDDVNAEYEKMRAGKWGASAKAPSGVIDSEHAPVNVQQTSSQEQAALHQQALMIAPPVEQPVATDEYQHEKGCHGTLPYFSEPVTI